MDFLVDLCRLSTDSLVTMYRYSFSILFPILIEIVYLATFDIYWRSGIGRSVLCSIAVITFIAEFKVILVFKLPAVHYIFLYINIYIYINSTISTHICL